MGIKSSEGAKELNVLWDSAASVSLITFSKAKELGLKERDVNLTMVKAGGAVENVKSAEYTLNLLDQQKNVIKFNVYGLPEISTKLCAIKFGKVMHLFPSIDEHEVRRRE